MDRIYLLEYREYYYHDESDDEDVEYRSAVGYFSDMEKVNSAIKMCVNHGLDSTKLFVKEYSFIANKNQKYVYILGYEFSILHDKSDDYVDYFYIFEPLKNEKDCWKLRDHLVMDKKYMKSSNKIFDSDSEEGFSVCKMKINLFMDCKKMAKTNYSLNKEPKQLIYKNFNCKTHLLHI